MFIVGAAADVAQYIHQYFKQPAGLSVKRGKEKEIYMNRGEDNLTDIPGLLTDMLL